MSYIVKHTTTYQTIITNKQIQTKRKQRKCKIPIITGSNHTEPQCGLNREWWTPKQMLANPNDITNVACMQTLQPYFHATSCPRLQINTFFDTIFFFFYFVFFICFFFNYFVYIFSWFAFVFFLLLLFFVLDVCVINIFCMFQSFVCFFFLFLVFLGSL